MKDLYSIKTPITYNEGSDRPRYYQNNNTNHIRDFLEREKHHNCSEFQNGMYIHPNERKRRECAYCGHKVLFLYYSIWWDKNGNLHRIINPWLYIKSLFLPRTIVKISSGMDMEYFPRLQIKWFF
jgi:hypothetical protein